MILSSNQLSIPDFLSQFPSHSQLCFRCGRSEDVKLVIAKLPLCDYSRTLHLCFYCRSNPRVLLKPPG